MDYLKTLTDVHNNLKFLWLNKSIVLYGGTNSGKTVIIKNIMENLSKFCHYAVIVCPTNNLNNIYTNLVPRVFIHTEITTEGKKNSLLELLDKILKKQKKLLFQHKYINDEKAIDYIFKKIPYDKRQNFENNIKNLNKKTQEICNSLNSSNINVEDKSSKIEYYKNIEKEIKLDLIKKCIIENSKYISTLSTKDKEIVRDVNVNPNVLIVLDDCAAYFKELIKRETFRTILYAGRHHRITIIISCQDDTDIGPEFRKNVMVSIFTDKNTCISNIERRPYIYNKMDKLYIINNIDKLFDNYQKLVFIKHDPYRKNFYRMKWNIIDDFEFGSPDLYDEGKEISRDN